MAKRKAENILLADVLKDFIRSNNKLQKGYQKISAEQSWHSVMGKTISKYTTKVLLENDTLHVQLSSSVLREELNYGKEKIITLLNQELGDDLIKKVILR